MKKRLRVPWYPQVGADDCGPTCLAMVLAAHGVHDAASECRELCNAGRDGTRLRTLVAVADRFGVAARAHRVRPECFASVALPVIAHWQHRHFVVVEQWAPSRVTIVDPATGRRTLTHDEFTAGFAGTVMSLEPRGDIVRRPKSRLPLWVWYLAAMFRDQPAQFALAQIVVGSLLLQGAGLAGPLFTKLVVDAGTHESFVSLGLMATAMSIVVLGKSVTTFVRNLVMTRLQTRLDARLTQGFFEHLLALPYRFFQSKTSGDLLMRLSSNSMIREILTTQLLSFVLDGPLSALFLIIMFVVSPPLALLAAAMGVAQGALAFASLRPLRDLAQRTVVAKTDEQSCLVELMKGIAYIKASAGEQRAYDRWVELFRRQLGVSVERSYLSAKVEFALGFARTASPLILLWYGAYLVAHASMPLGTMLALTTLATSFLAPVTSLVQSTQQLQLLDAYVERLTDVLETEQERRPEIPQRARATRLAGRIEARALSFRFSADGPAVVENVSFVITPGQKLGIVGPTGSGKSTILMLLLGLYQPTAGEVLYDGIPLAELDPRDVRRWCGVVLQDSAAFAGSFKTNILLNTPAASAEQIDAAAEIAGLANDIRRLPMAYETSVAEGGSNLSGGQRQRLAIARAIAPRPSILLLDEASSHLDVAAEAELNAHLERLRCTRIVIAHRLSAVRTADQILVLRHGHVVERGTHLQLLRERGMYAELAAAQSPTGSATHADRGLANECDGEHLTSRCRVRA
ncbi:MAG TPA: peptidase domain-containing ABC transporter [Gemmatimonadaceae bacterium]|nr:peptidase domain-containing ABC transporter [Gemmatimonadaceae bacterium]